MNSEFQRMFRFFPVSLVEKLRSQSGRNALASGGGAIINPALQLVAMPLLLDRLGAESFGLWVIINALIAASSVANFGLGDATTKFVAQHRANSEWNELLCACQTTLAMYLLLGAGTGLLVILSAPAAVEFVFRIPLDQTEVAVAALRVAAVALFLRFAYGTFEALIRGFDRYDVDSVFAVLTSVLTTVAAVVLAFMGFGLVGILVANVIILTITTLGLALAASRCMKSFRFAIPVVNRKALKGVLSFGFFTWLQTLNGVIVTQLDRLVIGATIGADSAGYYSICLQLVLTVQAIVSRAAAFIFPLAVRHAAARNWNKLLSLFRNGMYLTTILSFTAASALVVFAKPLLSLWISVEFANDSSFLLQMLAGWVAVQSTSVIPFYFLNATGGERLNALFGTISAAAFLTLALLAIPSIGAVGAAIARLGSSATSLISRAILLRRVFGERRWQAGPATILAPAAGLAVASLGALTMPKSLSDSAMLLVPAIYYVTAVGTCWSICWWIYKRFFSRLGSNFNPK